MQYSFVVIGDNETVSKEVLNCFENFPEYYCLGSAHDKDSVVDLILEVKPELVFLSLKKKTKTGLELTIIDRLYRYLLNIPYFVILSDTDDYALEAIKTGVFDYIIAPLTVAELRKTLLRFQKEIPLSGGVSTQIVENPHESEFKEEDIRLTKVKDTPGSDVDIQICIKSYGDYQFIALKDVVYLQADNNTTDFHLVNGKTLSAYKTLKHYENNLPPFFYRIHNSFVVNSSYVSRINTGKSICYLNNNEVSVPFSKTFKENIDTIIRKIAPEFI